ncbi:sulfhydryl oxidase [Rhizodiscina lignyota]|uniref:Sulfhydryl oxidase n=1 Tax=Rhizodiscina lignyota TaxID=1504668 RepID=A0A9P4I7A0_9PEZI|nr:sulfhydryl oxidase [Rhizodiscina lignyota]
MAGTGATRRFLLLGILAAFLVVFLYIGSFRDDATRGHLSSKLASIDTSDEILHGSAIAPKLGNETLKAELGRAAWKVFHTTLARFPDKPKKDESEALRSYIHLFQRLYPCGDCATHFGELLKKFPPQVSSRSAAAVWGCHVHNQVNERLKKPTFDCSKIGDFYDCGCADDEKDEKKIEGRDTREDLFPMEQEVPEPKGR